MNLTNNFANYLNEQYSHLSKKTVRNYKTDVSLFIRWYEEKFNVSLDTDASWIRIDTIDLYKKEKILKSNLSTSTIKRHLSSLRKFFEFLKIERIIPEDPFKAKTLLDEQSNIHDKWHLRRFRNYLSLNNKSNVTIKNYIFDIQRFLTWAQELVGEEALSNIDQTLFDEYKKYLLKKGLSAKTIKRNSSSLQKYLGWINTETYPQISNFKFQISNLITDKSIESGSKFTRDKSRVSELRSKGYSSFPPLRLIQKTAQALSFVLDATTITPIVKTIEFFQYSVANIQGKPIFKDIPSVNYEFKIRNISPSDLGYTDEIINLLKLLSWHKKIFHHMRHTRPKWYKIYHSYSITDYFHLGILILSMSILGFAIYQDITPIQEKSVLSSFTAYSPRILSFKGQLTDGFGDPITQVNTPLRVAVYNDEVASGTALLWQEVISVNPDENGAFSALIGTHIPIAPSIFSQREALWLGVAISDSPELTPRQQLSNVALSKDSEKLQGLSPITKNGGTKNVVLALDSSGDLTIGGDASPTFQATGGKFTLLGETLVLTTAPGTSSNVEVAPMDLGKIDLQKPIFNSTNNNNVYQAIGSVEIDDSLAVLATTSAQSAFTISQHSTGNLISAYTNGDAKFVINNSGNILSSTGSKWQPFSDSTSALNIANAAGNTFITFDTEDSRLRFLQDSEERGEIFYLDSDSTFHIRSASSLALSTNNSDASRVYIATSGNVGINTTAPRFRLDIHDSKDSSAAAQIFNTSTGADADGLIIKLGNTSGAVDSTNHFISFETSGIGIVGSVQGNGTGVRYETSGIADFAEYLKKDENQTIEYGSVVCLDEKGLVLPCNSNYNKIIGIASEKPGFLGGEDLGEKSIAVGLVGQVYTRVSTENGDIKPGDPLTSSSTPGVAVKAVDRGQIIGKALESFNGNTSEVCSGRSLTSEVDGVRCGKILVSVNVSWYDPDLAKNTIAIQEETLKDRVSAAKLDLVAIFEEFIKSSEIISPITKVDKIDSNIISPLPANTLATNINDLSETQASNSAVLEPDLAESKASTLAAQNQNTQNTRATGLSEDQTIRQSDLSDYLTIWNSEFSEFSEPLPIFPQGLISFGPASLSDTSITGQLSIGPSTGGLKLKYNSINVLGTDLALQPLRQGGLSLMGDLVYIDTDGNLKVDGNAQFAKNVKVGGDFTVLGNTTLNKLNLNLVKEAVAVSKKELIASGAAGTAFVHPHEIEVTIKNPLVSDKSLIYITPAGTPSGQIPYLIRQAPEKPALPARRSLGEGGSEVEGPALSEIEGSFTVGIASKSATKIPFNWLIIN